MRYGDQTSDLREELRRYVGKEVALVVNSGALRVVGRGELSLIDDNIKAVRVGDTTLTIESWQFSPLVAGVAAEGLSRSARGKARCSRGAIDMDSRRLDALSSRRHVVPLGRVAAWLRV